MSAVTDFVTQLERQLAKVSTDLDALVAQIAALRAQVATPVLTAEDTAALTAASAAAATLVTKADTAAAPPA